MLKIGITGPIGAGKSYISKLFADMYGIPVFDSDSVAKELQLNNEFVKSRIINLIGSEAYNIDGSVNCKYVADIIFNDPNKNEIIFDIIRGPLIARMYEDYYSYKYMRPNRPPFMLIENAIMIQEKAFHLMDNIILVNASYEVRMERVIKRGMEEEDFIRRNAKQMQINEMQDILNRHGVPSFMIVNEYDIYIPSIVEFYYKMITKK